MRSIALAAAAQSLGCDLLIKDAYTQSRLRQMIFGGATRHPGQCGPAGADGELRIRRRRATDQG
jgi:hypothetical protein